MAKTVNERVVLYRKLANLTQIEVAEKMGMKHSTYSQMERKGSVSAERILALAEIFNIKPEVLLYDSPENVAPNFSPLESETKNVMHQSNAFADSVFNPSPFTVTHKEENIVKILRNLSKSDYDEIINHINQKYKNSKKK